MTVAEQLRTIGSPGAAPKAVETDRDTDQRKLVAPLPKPLYPWRSTHLEDADTLAMQAERQALIKCRPTTLSSFLAAGDTLTQGRTHM